MNMDEIDEFGDDLIDGIETDKRTPVEHSGILSKWTNYINGWQARYVVLKNGSLRYFKSESETEIGCRGAISLQHATVTAHPFDECRFDVTVSDSLWYLRAANEDERHRWVEAIEMHKQQLLGDSAYGSEGNLKRQGSILSIASATSAGAQSVSSFKHGRSLQEKLAELDTYRDIVCRQIDNLQCYFDTCAQMTRVGRPPLRSTLSVPDQKTTPTDDSSANRSADNASLNRSVDDMLAMLRQHGLHATDFKGESHTFKVTTTGIVAILSHMIELMAQHDEAWRKRFDKEVERRRRLEEAYCSLRNQMNATSQQHGASATHQSSSIHERAVSVTALLGSPDLEEGPHSALQPDVFFDAVDAILEKRALEDETQSRQLPVQAADGCPCSITECSDHPILAELKRIVAEHLRDADDRMWNAEAVGCDWQLFAQDGDMRMYRRELEEEGRVIDPLKAVTKVRGVTGREMCMHFWDVRYRSDWEDTADGPPTVLERPAADTLVIYQKYQRVWPSAQRDSIYWSHLRHGRVGDDEDATDYWVVVNYTTVLGGYTPKTNGCVHIQINASMLCKTVVQPPPDGVRQSITRDDIYCYVQYTATVNPGGWVPAAALRAVYKREYPRFLKKFTKYVADDVRDKPIEF